MRKLEDLTAEETFKLDLVGGEWEEDMAAKSEQDHKIGDLVFSSPCPVDLC